MFSISQSVTSGDLTPNLHNITRGQSRDLWFWWGSFLITISRTSQSWTRTSNSTCTYTLGKLKFHLTKFTHFCEIFFFASRYTNIYILPLFTLIKPLSPKLLPHEFLISQYGIPLSVPQPIAKTAWLILFGGALKKIFCKNLMKSKYRIIATTSQPYTKMSTLMIWLMLETLLNSIVCFLQFW